MTKPLKKINKKRSVFTANAQRYDQWYERNRYAYESELEAVQRMIPARGIGLEIGVGTGRFAAPLGVQFGIDPSKEMMEYARLRGVDVRPGVGERIPFPDKTFSYVLIAIALCFVKDPKAVLLEAKRVLKEKGKIIIAVIDKDSFLGRYYRVKKSVFYKNARLFSIERLSCLLRTAGFGRFRYSQTLFTYPEMLSTVQKPRSGHGLGGFVVIRAVKLHGNTTLPSTKN